MANIETALGWASHLAWSRWIPVEGGGCELTHVHRSSEAEIR